MQVDLKEAIEFFQSQIPEHLRSPYLHPEYVQIDALRDPGLKPIFFIFRQDQQIFYYAFHLGVAPGELLDIQSPMGYGGPIATSDDSLFLSSAWSSFDNWCRNQRVLAEFVRFHPLLQNQTNTPYETIFDRYVVSIELQQKDLLMSYSTRARTAIRKAEKHGLNISWESPDSFAGIFPELYSQHLQAINADKYYQFPSQYLKSIVDWENSHLAICRLGEEVLAAAIFIKDTHYIEYHLSASTNMGKKFNATNLIIHYAALFGQQSDCQQMNLGGGTDAHPDNPLYFFKQSFSKEVRPFYIGKKIHLADNYQSLKNEWLKTHPASNRILFYR